MSDDKEDRNGRGQPGEEDEEEERETASEALSYAVADLLNSPEIREALKNVINSWADNKPAETFIKRLSLSLGYALAAIVFVGVGLLAWLRVISGEVTAGLLGSAIGYWFGQRQRSK